MITVSLSRATDASFGVTFTDAGDTINVAAVDSKEAYCCGVRPGYKLTALEADGMTYEVGEMRTRGLAALLARRIEVTLGFEAVTPASLTNKLGFADATSQLPEAPPLAGLGLHGWAEDSPVITIPKLLSMSEVQELHDAARALTRLQEPHRYDQPHESLFLHAACCVRVRLSIFSVAGSGSSTPVRLTLRPTRQSFFETACPALREKLLARMRALWPRELGVRCVEYHTYWAGGCLLDPDHIDAGSVLTMSALLSDPSSHDGGEFLTFADGLPVAHELDQGDAVVFYSERVHNVSAVMSGVRHSLVIELWEGGDNVADRHI